MGRGTEQKGGVRRRQRRSLPLLAAEAAIMVVAVGGIADFAAHHIHLSGTPPTAGALPSVDGKQCFPVKDYTKTGGENFAIPDGNKTVTVGLARSISGDWYRTDNPKGTDYKPASDGSTIPGIEVPGVQGKFTLVFDASQNGRNELCKEP